MRTKESQLLARRVVHYYENAGDFSKLKTKNHFTEEGVPKRTVYNILKRYEERENAEYSPIPPPPRTAATPENQRKLLKILKKDPSMLTRAAAGKLAVSQTTIMKMKLRDLRMRAYTKKKFPKYEKN